MVNMAMCNESFFSQDFFTPVVNTLHGTEGAMWGTLWLSLQCDSEMQMFIVLTVNCIEKCVLL